MSPVKETSHPHNAALIAAKKKLHQETAQRKTAEAALKESRLHYGQLLEQSLILQKQLRHLSHQILLAQEEERKHISHELHDEISQILTGINVRLATLKLEATANNGSLKRKIVNTQRLVEKSVEAVHRFARELRPAMLDDLGLVPALLTYMKEFGKRTGIRINFTSTTADKIEQLDSLKRTVLYRVAQEALTNVAKHAQASRITLSIHIHDNAISMEIADNGISFDVTKALDLRRRKRLGIIGMRERVEMVSGTFAIESEPDHGTRIHVRIPFHNGVKA